MLGALAHRRLQGIAQLVDPDLEHVQRRLHLGPAVAPRLLPTTARRVNPFVIRHVVHAHVATGLGAQS